MFAPTTILAGVFGAMIGYIIKHFLEKRLFIYKKRVNATEKLREAINVLSQGVILCAFLQMLDLEKVQNANVTDKVKIQNIFDILPKKTAKKIIHELEGLDLYSKIQPYIKADIWKLFKAYQTIIINASFFVLHIPHNLDLLKIDKIEESVIKTVIPIIPEQEKFIKEAPVTRQFFVEELVREKLLKLMESSIKKESPI